MKSISQISRYTQIYCYIQHMKALGLIVLFYVLPIVSLWELMTPGVGTFMTPGTGSVSITGQSLSIREYKYTRGIKWTTKHCYTQNMKALGLVVLKIFFYFSHDAPGAWPVWTPWARLTGFIKRIFILCYTQNRKALRFVVSEKIICTFSH